MADPNIPESSEESKARHTPGPWFLEDCFPNDHEIRKGPPTRRPTPSGATGVIPAQLICSVDNFDPYEYTANARLITAAPDMLEALKSVFEFEPKWMWQGGNKGKLVICRFCGSSVEHPSRQWPLRDNRHLWEAQAVLKHHASCPMPKLAAAIAKAEGTDD